METRNCQNCKKDFVIEQEDFSFYEKMKVPPPTFCPECRLIRRYNFRNERDIFRRLDAHTSKEIFSTFPEEAGVQVYENKYWFGTEWEPLSSGREYDFSRPFFEQFRDLMKDAPLPARSVYNLVNSDYCNEASEMKNCYLCFNSDYIENSAYIRKMNHTKDTFDCYEGTENELCYENVMVDKSYRAFYSLDCESCVDVWFSKGLRGCTNCFGCVNLAKKSYYFFNQPCTKEEYAEKIAAYTLDSYKSTKEIREKIRTFWLSFPVKFNHTLRTLDSTGERVYDSKNVRDSFSVRESEHLRYCQDIQHSARNSYDYSVWGDGTENIYESITIGMGGYNVKFSANCWENVRDLEYCFYCIGSKDCFGCVGLYKKEYCIFNKQYTKEEYEVLKAKIIQHMSDTPYVDAQGRVYTYGEFFPFDLSPLAYNQSSSHDFFPISQEVAIEKGYKWAPVNRREFETTCSASDLPDSIQSVDDSILKEIIQCESCKRAYRIIPIELQFYKKIGLPIPRNCHYCRSTQRFNSPNPPRLWQGSCMCELATHDHAGKCTNVFETSYAPDRPEIVYCESCYQKEIT